LNERVESIVTSRVVILSDKFITELQSQQY
jgi:hypothetical protein